MTAASENRGSEASGRRPPVFIGDIALDEYYTAGFWPQPGDKTSIETAAVYVGGSISNTARVFAGLGGSPEFVSLLRPGELSDRLLDALDREGVGHRHMLYSDSVADQRNLIFLVGGEHVVLTPDSDERPMEFGSADIAELVGAGVIYTTLQRARRLTASGRSGAKLLALLRESGRRIIFDLDVDGVGEDDLELVRGAHAVFLNDRGFERSFPGLAAADAEPVVQAWLARHGVGILIHSRAEHGLIGYTSERRIVIPGYRVPVVDVTGAGDTLGGSFVFGIESGWALEEVLEFAVAAASRSVMHLGPTSGIATLEEIRSFREEFAGTRIAG